MLFPRVKFIDKLVLSTRYRISLRMYSKQEWAGLVSGMNCNDADKTLCDIYDRSSFQEKVTLIQALSELNNTSNAGLWDRVFIGFHNGQKNGFARLIDFRHKIWQVMSDDSFDISARQSTKSLERSCKSYLKKVTLRPGALELRNLDNTCSLELKKRIMEKEAVHPMVDLEDLKHRMGPERRILGLFHKELNEEPLVFLEIALTNQIVTCVQDIIDAPNLRYENEQIRDTAMFYSVTSTQRGLKGIYLGNFMLKSAIELLKKEFPRLSTFCTLSPMPLFKRWLRDQVLKPNDLDAQTNDALKYLLEIDSPEQIEVSVDGFRRTRIDWNSLHLRPEIVHALRKFAFRYLVEAKNPANPLLPLDPVGGFHLGNGSCIYRINIGGDRTAKGWRQSLGTMVNYYYEFDKVEKRVKQMAETGKIDLYHLSIDSKL